MVNTKVHACSKKFRIDTKSLQTGDDIQSPGLKCYTDCSKMGKKCGLGVALITNNNDRQTGLCQSERLADECTIFQAEVLAILRACQPIKEYFMLNPDKINRYIS